MRGAGLRLGIRRVGLHAVGRRAGRHGVTPWTAEACRQRSSAENVGAAVSADAPVVEPPVPRDAPAGTAAAALFDAEFRDVATTLDVAPIRRPHVVGSLVCSVDHHPVSIVLVEDCDGTAVEAVTEAVQWHAVRCAAAIRHATQTTVRTFFAKHVCAAHPRTMAQLDSLDLSLRLRLVLRGGSAEAAPPAEWCCSAALLDPWQSHPHLSPVARPSAAVGEVEGVEAVGELLSVVDRVFDSVDAEVQRRLAQHTQELAREARVFIGEAGGDLDDAALTAHCLSGALRNRAAVTPFTEQSFRASWGEVKRRRSTWLLESAALVCADDADHPLAFRLSLRRVVHVRHRNEAGALCSTAVALQSALVQRGLGELLDIREKDRTLHFFDNSLHPSSTTGTLPLKAASHLAQLLTEGKASWAESGARGPLDLIDHLLRAAAVLSPSIAYDWVGAARCGDVSVSASAVAGRSRPPVGLGLPACVRWTTLVGRRLLNEFAARERAGDEEGNADAVANGGPALPPVWPLLRCVRAGAGPRRHVHALRELLRLECGLRLQPHVHVALPSSLPLSLQYDAALCITSRPSMWHTGAPTARRDEFTVVVYRTSRYADVVTAALAHTPWAAAPFLHSLSPPGGGTGDAPPGRRRLSRAPWMWTVRVAIRVPSLTQLLRSGGVVAARWSRCGSRIDYALLSGKRGPSFRGVNTVAGYARLVRYGARGGQHVTAQVPLGASPAAVLHHLLAAMTVDGAETGSSGSGVGAGGAPLHLPLPLTDSAATVEAATDGQRERDVHALLSVVGACCRERDLLALVVPAPVEAADMVFLRYWPVVAPLMSSWGGPLQARLRPARTGEDAKDGGSGTGHELVIATAASAPLSVRLDDAVGCMSAVYGALRTALWRSRPELFTTHGDGADAEAGAALPFLRLATLADFAEALLFTSVVEARGAWDPQGLARHLFSGNIVARGVGSTSELWLDLAPDTPPLLLSPPVRSDAKVSQLQSPSDVDFIRSALKQQCAAASALYWAVWRLTKRLRTAAYKNHAGALGQCLHVRLSCKWGPPPASTSPPPTSAPASWPLQFVAELCSGDTHRERELRIPHTSDIGAAWNDADEVPSAAVLQREAGPDGFAVVWRLLHGPVLGDSETEALPADWETSIRHLRSVPPGFVPAILRGLARLHELAEVGLHYSPAEERLVLVGRRAPRAGADAPAREAAIELVSEPTPPGALLARLFLLPRRLLLEDLAEKPAAAPWRVVPHSELSRYSNEDLTRWLCDVLEASPADFERGEAHRIRKVWYAGMAVPLRVLHLTVAASGACEPSSFLYIHVSHAGRRPAMRGLLLYLALSVLYPHRTPSIEGADVQIAFHPLPGWFSQPSSQPTPGALPPPLLQAPQAVAASTEPAVCATPAEAAATPQRTGAARPRKTARVRRSVVDLIHEHVAGALGGMVDGVGGRVALQLSQTFGLKLVYTSRPDAADAASAPGATPPQQTVVQLVREAWLPDVWAPQQVLAAELRVVHRIFAQERTTAEARAFVAMLLSPEAAARLAPLQCGPDVRAKPFCVSFFHRYFGWRVCERGDVEELSLTRGHSDVVVVECVGSVRRTRLDGPARDAVAQPPRGADALADAGVTATLQLVQIVPRGETTEVRLGRIVAESRAASRDAALEGLWGPCVERIAASFDVSPGQSSGEADRLMARFMHACLDLPPALS